MNPIYHKTYWYDHRPNDDNNGLVYGIEDDSGDYVEWFATKKERNAELKRIRRECRMTIGIDKQVYNNVKNNIKVYILDGDCISDGFEFRQLEREGNYLAIMQEAENNGDVYSLLQFQDMMNGDDDEGAKFDFYNSFIYIA